MATLRPMSDVSASSRRRVNEPRGIAQRCTSWRESIHLQAIGIPPVEAVVESCSGNPNVRRKPFGRVPLAEVNEKIAGLARVRVSRDAVERAW